MDVGSEADVIGKIPADVIWIVVEDDVIGRPVPAGAVVEIVRCDAEEISTEPEAHRTASGKTPDMSAAGFTGKMSVLPRVVKMIIRVVRACIVADPLIVGVHVRRFGMAFLLVDCRPPLCLGGWSGMLSRRGTVAGNVATANLILRVRRRSIMAPLLAKSHDGADQYSCENSCELFHRSASFLQRLRFVGITAARFNRVYCSAKQKNDATDITAACDPLTAAPSIVPGY